MRFEAGHCKALWFDRLVDCLVSVCCPVKRIPWPLNFEEYMTYFPSIEFMTHRIK